MDLFARIRGWAPESEEHVEIPPRPAPPRPSALRIFTFQSSQSTDVTSPHSSPAGCEPSSPASCSSSEGGFQSDHSQQRRKIDPFWAARPRNPFIIFRCEYSKQHSKEGKRVRRPPGSIVEKTLSKRAADAWHVLPPEEKNRFKELADQERDEHARMHPNYRFRPMKRGGKRPPKRVPSSSSPRTPASVVAPVPRYPPPPATPEPPPPPPPPPADMAAVKATRRRSASVPSLPMGQHPFISDFRATHQAARPDIKRARSATGDRGALPLPTSYEGLSFDPKLLDTSYSPDLYEESFTSQQADFPFAGRGSAHGLSGYLSPLNAVGSSLANWNAGEDQIPSGSAPSSWPPPTDVGSYPPQLYTDYSRSSSTGSAQGLNHENIIPYEQVYDWSVPQFPLTTNATITTEDPMFAPADPCNAVEYYAPQDYGIALEEPLVWGEGGLNEVDTILNEMFYAL